MGAKLQHRSEWSGMEPATEGCRGVVWSVGATQSVEWNKRGRALCPGTERPRWSDQG